MRKKTPAQRSMQSNAYQDSDIQHSHKHATAMHETAYDSDDDSDITSRLRRMDEENERVLRSSPVLWNAHGDLTYKEGRSRRIMEPLPSENGVPTGKKAHGAGTFPNTGSGSTVPRRAKKSTATRLPSNGRDVRVKRSRNGKELRATGEEWSEIKQARNMGGGTGHKDLGSPANRGSRGVDSLSRTLEDTPDLIKKKAQRAAPKPNQALLQEKRFLRWPNDDDELHLFVQAIWGYRIPRTKVCDDHSSPFDAFREAYFGREPVSVWEASRGFGGKTVMLAILCLTEALCLSAGVVILGGSGAQSQMAHRSTDAAWDSPNAPRASLVKSTQFDTVFTNGGWIRSLTASPTAVRGPHPLRLRLDEIDEMDIKILEAAQGQPMRNPALPGIDTQTVMSSTHQHPDGTMTEILNRAKDNRWPVHTWCYKESSNPTDGWLSDEEIERKRREITSAMWETEYDLQEPNFEGRAIDAECIERAFDPGIGSYVGDASEAISVEGPGDYEPNRFAPYVTGVDWAKEQDFTVVATFRTDHFPWMCVAWKRYNKIPWPNAVNRAQHQWRRYGGKLVHDNTGLGDVVDDYLQVDPHERRQHVVNPVNLVGNVRTSAFNEYISGIENGLIVYPRIKFAYDEHRYCTTNDLFGGGHPPDSFAAGALAWTLHPPLHIKRADHSQSLPLPIGIRAKSPWKL